MESAMDILEIMRARHSVRQYSAEKIEPQKREALEELARECNEASGLNIQLFFEEPKCFAGEEGPLRQLLGVWKITLPLWGRRVRIWRRRSDITGEKLVLKAQELGLSTCWVGADPRKESGADRKGGRSVACVIAVGYGKNQGKPHKGQTAGETLQLLCENAGLVCQGYGGGASCADSNESAEILFYAGGRPGKGQGRKRLSDKNGPGNCEISL